MIWDEWITEMESLPAGAPEWEPEHVEEFIEAIRIMAELKLGERQAGRQQLQQSIAELNDEYADALRRLPHINCRDWTAEHCALSEIPSLIEKIGSFGGLLREHSVRWVFPETSSDRHAWHEALTTLEEEIDAKYEDLRLALSVPRSTTADKDNRLSGLEDEAELETSSPESPDEFERYLNAPASVPAPAEELMMTMPPQAEVTEAVPAETVVEDLSGPPRDSANEDVYEHEDNGASGNGLQEGLVPFIYAPLTSNPPQSVPPPTESETVVDFLDEEFDDLEEHDDFTDEEEVTATAPHPAPAVPPGPPLDLSKLHPPQLLANYIRAQGGEEYRTSLLWSLIADDDIPAAYWLSQSLAERGLGTPVEPWLLAAVQGARWLVSDDDPIANDLLEFAVEHPLVEDEEDEKLMLRLAASLRSVLLAPGCGLETWLRAPAACPVFDDLIRAVSKFTEGGVFLDIEQAKDVEEAGEQEDAIVEASAGIGRWLSDAQSKRVAGAGSVWIDFFKPKSELATLLQPALEDQRPLAAQLRRGLIDWLDPHFVARRIEEIDLIYSEGRPKKRLGSLLRDKIQREVSNGVHKARQWCDLAETHLRREKNRQNGKGRYLDRLDGLRADLRQVLPDIESTLDGLCRTPQRPSLEAAMQCLRRTLAQMRNTVRLGVGENGDRLPTRDFSWLLAGGRNLEQALARWLWLMPDLTLQYDKPVSPHELHGVADALCSSLAGGMTIECAVEGWISKRDLRPIEYLLKHVPDKARAKELLLSYTRTLTESRRHLLGDMHRTTDEVERAFINGTITDERVEYLSAVNSISPDEVFFFSPELNKLNGIRAKVKSAARSHLRNLRAQWRDLRPKLVTHTEIPPQTRRQIQEFVKTALEARDVLAVEECIAGLTEVLGKKEYLGGLRLEQLGWTSASSRRDVLKGFLEVAKQQIHPWLQRVSGQLQKVPDAILGGRSLFGVPPPAENLREEGAAAVRAWLQLKGDDFFSDRAAEGIGAIIRFLGFRLIHVSGSPVKVQTRKGNWLHAKAALSSGNRAKPIPQFGSAAEASEGAGGNFDVICLRGSHSAEQFAQLLDILKLGVRSVIVLYLGPLGDMERCRMVGMTHERSESLALLDENLLLFLTGEEDRLKSFFRCALPFSTVKPVYTSKLNGDVPREMFFGRDDMIRAVLEPRDTNFVYGGRQMGKTAMLRHIEERYHKPEAQMHVWFETLDKKFGPYVVNDTRYILRRLRDRFQAGKLLKSSQNSDDPDQIVRYIRDAMKAAPDARVLALLDEADEFFAADAADDFAILRELRDLMSATDDRLKVVLAGNRNVHRLSRINDPLIQLGKLLVVGPLDPPEAQQLIREPFEVLGFRFADDTVVLRILSYTNYYAGLIQVFCHDLLERMYGVRGDSLPPHAITHDDVEAVYRNQETREAIRYRFDVTLKLRQEYELIAYLMILDQLEAEDGYSKTYSADELLDKARSAWPQGFDDVSIEMMKVNLEEMEALGVLVRDAAGRLRLRSPNVVRMMGEKEDIVRRMVELSAEMPKDEYDLDSFHSSLGGAARLYNPLTYAQERALNLQQTGVGIVMASRALGADLLPEALSRFTSADAAQGRPAVSVEIPPEVGGDALHSWLNQLLLSHEEGLASGSMLPHYVLHRRVGCDDADVEGLVNKAITYCNINRSRKRVLQLLLLLDPEASWSWLALPQDVRARIKEQVNIITRPRRWNLSGIRMRLNHLHMISTDIACQQVLDVTGGWPFLLDAFFGACAEQPDKQDLSESISLFAAGMAEDDGPASGFREALGVEQVKTPWEVLRFIRQFSVTQVEDISPSVFRAMEAEALKDLTETDCQRSIEFLKVMNCVDVEVPAIRVDPLVERTLARP